MEHRKLTRLVGELRATLDGRTEQTAVLLQQSARETGCWISGDGRMGEADLARLLGIAPGSLANKRREGSGPPAFALGGGGHRITYRITEVAAWIEASRES